MASPLPFLFDLLKLSIYRRWHISYGDVVYNVPKTLSIGTKQALCLASPSRKSQQEVALSMPI